MFKQATNLAVATVAAVGLAGCMMSDGGMSSTASSASTSQTVMVGGAAMFPTRNIIENAVNSADHTTLVAAVKAAGLVETLSGPGPFTVFAPTNTAFEALPPGTVPTLLQPENKGMLTSVLTYHVVPGRLASSDLARMISRGGGMASLTTANGGMLTARMMGSDIVIVDANGGVATVTQADVMQSNGVIHVTNKVSLPG
ncbi:fasciclin domain-containing protein [Leptolyngbya sp. 15MV]|nr:fasciclin domain-containing protein [Leptolyngbya sp. 15MV]